MKIARHVLIRDPFRGLFLCREGHWTCDSSVARDFEYTLSAVAFCVREKLSSAEVVVKLPGLPDAVLSVDHTAEHPGSAGSD